MKIAKTVVGGIAAVVSFASFADYELTTAPQSLAEWMSGGSYAGGVAPTAGEAATVVLPANMNALVDDDSAAFVGGFARIVPQHKTTSVLTIDVSTDCVFGCSFYYKAREWSTDTATRGKIVKTGLGTLSLASGATSYDYFTDLEVSQGILKLYGSPEKKSSHVYGRITVGPDGILVPGANTRDETISNAMISLAGSGVVSNDVGTAAQCRIVPYGDDGKLTEFSGKIVGKITYYGNGCELFTGVESTFSGEFHPYYNRELMTSGIAGVMKFGNPGEPSSIGTGSVVLGEVGARVLYLGTGETTTKEMTFGDTSEGKQYPGIIDAGAHGGLVLNGALTPRKDALNQRLWLTGSNVEECVVGGALNVNGSTRAFVSKRGPGTWRFSDVARTGISGIAVEEGTLRFDSLAERGTASALGDGLVRTIDKWVAAGGTLTEVPYDFKLGTATTAGTMEFTGTKESCTTTRPLVLAGNGELKNSGTNLLFRGGISSVVSDPTTLTLSGDSTADSVVSSVSDGDGTVSIIKDGDGTWVIDGTNTAFSGGIDVKKGTLVLRGMSDFTWYRWTIRGNLRPAEGSSSMDAVSEFAMFDKDGHRVDLGLVTSGTGLSGVNLKESEYRTKVSAGSASFAAVGEVNRDVQAWSSGGLTRLFDGRGGSDGKFYVNVRTNVVGTSSYSLVRPHPDNRESWLRILMRHAPGAAEAVTYDWASWGGNAAAHPASWTLEGSTDGCTWILLDDVMKGPTTSASYNFQWAYNGEHTNSADGIAMGTADDPHAKGRPFACITDLAACVYSNVVSVASGATIEAHGKIELAALKVNAKDAGTVKGFSFAETGTVDLEEYDSSISALPLTFTDCTETENFENWSVKRNGRPKPNMGLVFANGVLKVIPSGLVLIVK